LYKPNPSFNTNLQKMANSRSSTWMCARTKLKLMAQISAQWREMISRSIWVIFCLMRPLANSTKSSIRRSTHPILTNCRTNSCFWKGRMNAEMRRLAFLKSSGEPKKQSTSLSQDLLPRWQFWVQEAAKWLLTHKINQLHPCRIKSHQKTKTMTGLSWPIWNRAKTLRKIKSSRNNICNCAPFLKRTKKRCFSLKRWLILLTSM